MPDAAKLSSVTDSFFIERTNSQALDRVSIFLCLLEHDFPLGPFRSDSSAVLLLKVLLQAKDLGMTVRWKTLELPWRRNRPR